MPYFSKFPVVIDYEIQGQFYNGLDITRRTDVVKELKNNRNAYFEYDISDGESPEMLADRIYDDPDLFWVIFVFNDIFDVSSQWPLPYSTLNRYINREYGENVNAVHHYISASTGAIVDSDHVDYDRIIVTNYEHEVNLNDEKRSIKIPDPNIVPRIVRIHDKMIRA